VPPLLQYRVDEHSEPHVAPMHQCPVMDAAYIDRHTSPLNDASRIQPTAWTIARLLSRGREVAYTGRAELFRVEDDPRRIERSCPRYLRNTYARVIIAPIDSQPYALAVASVRYARSSVDDRERPKTRVCFTSRHERISREDAPSCTYIRNALLRATDVGARIPAVANRLACTPA
jgi:hypothetical protein